MKPGDDGGHRHIFGPGSARTAVFVNYRRDDTAGTATVLAEALRLRIGPERVFIDSSSIQLGHAFPQVIEDAIGSSAVLAVLIGPGWDSPPLRDRLEDEQDWVRKEILLANTLKVPIVPVLVNRAELPRAEKLPHPLRFMCQWQFARVRPSEPGSVEALADRLTAAIGSDVPRTPDAHPMGAGVKSSREALDGFARRVLPPAQQWSGNRDRLVDLALAVLGPTERLVFLAPARLPDRPRGSATAMVTETDLVLVDVAEDLRIRGETRLPLAWFGRVEIVPTFLLFADLLAHTTSGALVSVLGLFRDQARQLADHIRQGGTRKIN